MSYPETENTYNTLIESKIYRTSILFVILFAYIAISKIDIYIYKKYMFKLQYLKLDIIINCYKLL